MAYSGNNESELIKKHTYDTSIELRDGSKDDYTFDGWFTTSDCTGKPVTILREKEYTEGPIKLYAK